MSQFLEIEFKNLLTEFEYQKLLNFFNINKKEPLIQTNYYFDTTDFALKRIGAALRVRIKDGSYELTLKEQAEVGLLETTDIINKQEFDALLNSHIIPQKTVFRQLQLLNLHNIHNIANLTTIRYEFPYLCQLIALDQSIYYDYTDYEIELETNDPKIGEAIFKNILRENDIPVRVAPSKIKRAYEYKIKKGY